MHWFINLNYSDDMLQDLSKTPEFDYVSRQLFNNDICKQFRQINRYDGHILVYVSLTTSDKVNSRKTNANVNEKRLLLTLRDEICYITK